MFDGEATFVALNGEEARIVCLAVGASVLNETCGVLVELAQTLGALEAALVPLHVRQNFEDVLVLDGQQAAFTQTSDYHGLDGVGLF